MLGQIADLFDETTWYAIFAVCWGAPVLAIMIRACRDEVPPAAVVCSLIFYLMVVVLWLGPHDGIATVLFGLATLAAGPVVALTNLLVDRKRHPPPPRDPQGFPVIPVRRDEDTSSNQ